MEGKRFIRTLAQRRAAHHQMNLELSGWNTYSKSQAKFPVFSNQAKDSGFRSLVVGMELVYVGLVLFIFQMRNSLSWYRLTNHWWPLLHMVWENASQSGKHLTVLERHWFVEPPPWMLEAKRILAVFGGPEHPAGYQSNVCTLIQISLHPGQNSWKKWYSTLQTRNRF